MNDFDAIFKIPGKAVRLTEKSFEKDDIAVFLIQWGNYPKNVGFVRGKLQTSSIKPKVNTIDWEWDKERSGWYDEGKGSLREYDKDFQEAFEDTIFKGNDMDKIKRTASLIERDAASLRRVYV